MLAIQGVAIAWRAIGPVKRRANSATTAAMTIAATVATSREAPRIHPTRAETISTSPAARSKRLIALVPRPASDQLDRVGQPRHGGLPHPRRLGRGLQSAASAACGASAREKPSLAASFRRISVLATGLTSPERLISPNTTQSCGSAASRAEDTRAAAAARSAAGSVTFRPPATFK